MIRQPAHRAFFRSRYAVDLILALLSNYAEVLAKNHPTPEAGAIEARAAALRRGRPEESMVDWSELMVRKTRR